MAVIDGNGLKYRGDTPTMWVTDAFENVESTRSTYEMWLAGRLVLLASVVNGDPKLTIQLGLPDADVTDKWHLSEGHAIKGIHSVPAKDGGDVPDGLSEHVDGVSVQAYVYPMLPLILVKMYNLGVAHE